MLDQPPVAGEPEPRPFLSVPASGNPFPGFRSFEVDDSALFFGRSEQIDELLVLLQQTRFLVVVGESGCGKSSMVRAGLIPAVQRGELAELGSHWRIALFRPGSDPLGNLAHALNQFMRQSDLGSVCRELERSTKTLPDVVKGTLAKNGNLLVVVDQFEEVFRYHSDAKERNGQDSISKFIQRLLNASQQKVVPIYVVLTLRSDFLGNCGQFPRLAEALNGGQYLIPQMTRKEKQEAIEGPIAVGDAGITHRLVQRLLNDSEDSSDSLPILQHALMRTWQVWERRCLKGESIDTPDYQAVGGLTEALNLHAEEVFHELSPEDQLITKKIFQRLTEMSKNGRETRRPTAVKELCAAIAAPESKVIAIINVFGASGRTFLTSPGEHVLDGESVIDVSHESLIRLWERLTQWVLEETKSAKIYKRLAESALAGRALYRDQDLKEALQWRKDTKPNTAWAQRYHPAFDQAMNFLERSQKAVDTDRRKIKSLFWAICILVSFSFTLLLRSLHLAQREGKVAVARLLAMQSNFLRKEESQDLQAISLLATESMRRTPLLDNDQALRESLQILRRPTYILEHKGSVNAVTVSADHRWIATASADKTARLLEATTGKQVSVWPHQDEVRAVAFSHDSTRLATGSLDNMARVFDLGSGKELARLQHNGPVFAVAFSPDDRWVATASYDQTARVFDATSGQEIARFAHQGPVTGVAFSPDGRRLATGSDDNKARVFDVASRRELSHLTHGDRVVSVDYSSNGLYVATGSVDSTARVFDASSGREVARLPHNGVVNAVRFSPDNRWVATASDDKTARVFNATNSKEIASLTHQSFVLDVAFSEDGRWAATASADHTSRVFDISNGKEAARLVHGDIVRSVIFAKDGREVVTGSADHTVRVFHTAPTTEMAYLRQPKSVLAVSFSSDGRLGAIGGDDNLAHIFEVTTGKEIALLPHPEAVFAIAFSRDSRRVITGCADKNARVFEIATGAQVAQFIHSAEVHAVAFSPDGRRVITGSFDNSAWIFDVASGKEPIHLMHQSPVAAVTFSPDGRFAATGSLGTKIFDASSGREIKHFGPEQEAVVTVAFSPDGLRLATGGFIASLAGNARVFDVAGGREIIDLPFGGRVGALAFSADGRWVAAGSDDRTAAIFESSTGKQTVRIKGEGDTMALVFVDEGRMLRTSSVARDVGTKSDSVFVQRHFLRPQEVINEACSIVTRNLTSEEWKQYIRDEPYQKTCQNLP